MTTTTTNTNSGPSRASPATLVSTTARGTCNPFADSIRVTHGHSLAAADAAETRTISTSVDDDEEEGGLRICRICNLGDDDPKEDPLIAPCRCQGWVHASCLSLWRYHQPAKEFSQCAACKSYYHLLLLESDNSGSTTGKAWMGVILAIATDFLLVLVLVHVFFLIPSMALAFGFFEFVGTVEGEDALRPSIVAKDLRGTEHCNKDDLEGFFCRHLFWIHYMAAIHMYLLLFGACFFYSQIHNDNNDNNSSNNDNNDNNEEAQQQQQQQQQPPQDPTTPTDNETIPEHLFLGQPSIPGDPPVFYRHLRLSSQQQQRDHISKACCITPTTCICDTAERFATKVAFCCWQLFCPNDGAGGCCSCAGKLGSGEGSDRWIHFKRAIWLSIALLLIPCIDKDGMVKGVWLWWGILGVLIFPFVGLVLAVAFAVKLVCRIVKGRCYLFRKRQLVKMLPVQDLLLLLDRHADAVPKLKEGDLKSLTKLGLIPHCHPYCRQPAEPIM